MGKVFAVHEVPGYVFPRTGILVKRVESSASTERSMKLYLPWVLGFLQPERCSESHAVRSYQITSHHSADRCTLCVGYSGEYLLPRRRVGDGGEGGSIHLPDRHLEGNRELLFSGDHKCVPFPTAGRVYRHMTRLQVETVM